MEGPPSLVLVTNALGQKACQSLWIECQSCLSVSLRNTASQELGKNIRVMACEALSTYLTFVTY